MEIATVIKMVPHKPTLRKGRMRCWRVWITSFQHHLVWSIRRARAKTCCVEENCCYDVFWWNLRVCIWVWSTSSSHALGMLFCMHRHCRKEQPPQRPCKKWKSIIIFLIEFHYIRSSLHNKFDLKSNADKYWAGKPSSQFWLQRWHCSPMNFPNQLIHDTVNFHQEQDDNLNV